MAKTISQKFSVALSDDLSSFLEAKAKETNQSFDQVISLSLEQLRANEYDDEAMVAFLDSRKSTPTKSPASFDDFIARQQKKHELK